MRVKLDSFQFIPEAFAVMLRLAPQLPDDSGLHSISHARQVITASKNNNENRWGWVHLDGDEKDAIGEAMMIEECDLDKWYWCAIYKEES